MPAALDVPWDEIKMFMVAGGSYSEANHKWGVKEAAIRQRCKREFWPVTNRVSQLVTEVKKNREMTQNLAESWIEKGEQHRKQAFQFADTELRKVAKKGLPITDWSEAMSAVKIARLSSGLESGENGATHNPFGWLVTLQQGVVEKKADIVEIETQDIQVSPNPE